MFDVSREKVVVYIFYPTHRAYLLYISPLKQVFNSFLNHTYQFSLSSPRLIDYVNRLRKIGILVSKSTAKRLIKIAREQKTEVVKKSPRFVALEITNACNFSCKHCFGAFGESHSPLKFMDYTLAVRFLNSLRPLDHITLTGGEPLLHPFIEDFLILALEVARNVRVNTNGSKFNKKIIPLLVHCESIQISIYGFGEDEYISFTNQRTVSFKQICNNIQRYTEAGVNVILTYSRGELNGPNIDHFYSLAKTLNVPAKHGICMPFGRATRLIEKGQYEAGSLAIPTVSGLGEEVSRSFKQESCSDEQIVIASDGSLLPCTLLRQPMLGNVFKTPLPLIQKTGTYIAYKNTLDVDNIPMCNRCPFRYLCGGLCFPLRESINLTDHRTCPIAKRISYGEKEEHT